ncbi:OPT family oligopeptide transporter [Curtanaerobium respiraculi]|uniref:OPT family oligopeptide transporter n=1 Tax=Curtanaerobium respiraculi TaxID=2949669 RepID=UPI0024B3943E|nr:oligopeptide transporter, OPT family [Curtanaerobium respiraculi]
MDRKPEFKPYIAPDKVLPELTATSIVLGILLAVVFGAANAYLGLRVGMTISASIPAAVISMGVIRFVLRRDSILENNMVQTIGSAGESVAAGAIFTLPALFIWASEGSTDMPSMLTIGLIALLGGTLGVLFMIPLRDALIVQEHGVLPYPEGTACAEVLEAGEERGSKAGLVFGGLGIAALYKFIADGVKLFPSEIAYEFKSFPGSGIGADVLPALLGVGYIVGPKVSATIVSGSVLAWFVLMPMIVIFGSGATVFPGTAPIGEIFAASGAVGIWSSYIRYIGAGAVAMGGIITLIKAFPLIVRTFKDAIGKYGTKVDGGTRTSTDLPMQLVMLGIGIIALALWLIPTIPVNLVGAILIIVFGFFFVTVSSRMVGIVGSSNNPVSGMTIATLLIVTAILKAIGIVGTEGMIAAITIGSVICIATAIAGDTSQDLKTGYIVGATPYRQQIGELIGVVASAVAVGGILYLLSTAWGFGSTELPAPQAIMMKMIVEGVMNANLPWALIFTGAFIAVVIELIGVPVLPFAVGIYLPIFTTLPIMVGGTVRWAIDKVAERRNAKKIAAVRESEGEEAAKAVEAESAADAKDAVQSGVLYASGMIAGEGLVGILLAAFAVIQVGGGSLGEAIDVSKAFSLGDFGSLVFFALLIASMVWATKRKAKASSDAREQS